MITNEQIEQYNNLTNEQNELSSELNRIKDFVARDSENKDNKKAIQDNKILVKFSGTACRIPIGIFIANLTQRKKEIEDRLIEIDDELQNIN